MLAIQRHANHEGYRYERHRPEESVLYRVVSEHWSSFRARIEAKRVLGILEKKGRTIEGLLNGDEGSVIDSALGACYEVAARTPKTRRVDPPRMGKGECAVVVQGFNVYAGDAIDGRDRKRVERMCRYLARPPIATERLTEDGDVLRYEMKKVWRDGTRFVTLDPHELIARICAMVPPPRLHMIRFHGELAPNSALRERVVASARPYVLPNVSKPAPVQLPLFEDFFRKDEAEPTHARRKPWAWLLRHVFAVDVNVCPACAGRMKWRQVALTADAIREGLARAGLLARGPPTRKRVPMGQLVLPFPKSRRA
ncbi:MAG: transposase [Polyangiaceae bacterium]|nr:transposase [Polyangiaceae bacterium]